MPIDDEETAALVASLLVEMDPSLDEFQVFTVIADFAVHGRIDLSTIENIAEAIRATKFNPATDIMH